MRKSFWFSLAMGLVLAVALVAGGCGSGPSSSKPKAPSQAGTPSSPAANQPYKIGLLTTLSGPMGPNGTEIVDAAKLRVDQINAAGGINGHQVELFVQDDGADASKAVIGFNKLVKQDDVAAVTGTADEPIELPLRPMAAQDQVTYIPLNPTIPSLRAKHNPWAFNMAGNEFVHTAAWLDYIESQHYTRVAAIEANDNLTEINVQELKKEGASKGITVDILPDTVNMDQVDVMPQVIKLKQLIAEDHSQILVNCIWGFDVPMFLKDCQEVGLNIPNIGFDPAADPSILKMGYGKALDGFMVPGYKTLADQTLPDADPQRPAVVAFDSAYQAKYGALPGTMQALAWDAVGIITDAMKTAGTDRSKLRDTIENTKDYAGVTGVRSFSPTDHEGLTMDCFALYKIENLKFVVLKDYYQPAS